MKLGFFKINQLNSKLLAYVCQGLRPLPMYANNLPTYFRLVVLLLFFLFLLPFGSFAQRPDTVKVGCYLISLHDFNFRDKEYTARFWIWLLYNNNIKKFNLEQQIEIPNAKSIEKPDVLIDQLDSLDWLQIKMKCVMKQAWQVGDYPFDEQQLKIYVENSKFDSRDLVFVADTAGKSYDPELTIDGWRIEKFAVKTDESVYETSFGDPKLSNASTRYSRFVIALDLKRDAWGLFIKVFLGMYVAFCISFISFFIENENVDPRFGLPVGGVFASVGNKYVIDSILPETSQLTLVDILHGFTLVCIFFIIALAAISLYYFKHEKFEKAHKIDKYGGIAIFSCFLLFNLVFILLAIF